jgi:hypothetical protein
VAARALVQQVVRMSSRLDTICPSHTLWPLDRARAARTAALQTIRDGLLSAADLAALLPDHGRLAPGALLALVDSAALRCTTTSAPALPPQAAPRTSAPAPVHAPAPEPTRTGAPQPVHPDPAPHPAPATAPQAASGATLRRDERTDA